MVFLFPKTGLVTALSLFVALLTLALLTYAEELPSEGSIILARRSQAYRFSPQTAKSRFWMFNMMQPRRKTGYYYGKRAMDGGLFHSYYPYGGATRYNAADTILRFG